MRARSGLMALTVSFGLEALTAASRGAGASESIGICTYYCTHMAGTG